MFRSIGLVFFNIFFCDVGIEYRRLTRVIVYLGLVTKESLSRSSCVTLIILVPIPDSCPSDDESNSFFFVVVFDFFV